MKLVAPIKAIIFALLIISVVGINNWSYAQPVFSNNGDWSTAANWVPAAVPSGSTTAVDIKNNRNPTVSTTSNVIGSVTALGTTTITINNGADLTLGSQADFDVSTFANLTLNNNSTLTIDGTLIIYGDLIVNNTLTLSVTGTFKVYGNIVLNNNADLSVSGTGSLTVNGDFTAGTNTSVSTSGSGTIAVGGSLSVGGGTSSITGTSGSITVGGACDLGGAVCPATVTPVELIYFTGIEKNNSITLTWATAFEENFDHFEIEKVYEGDEFESLISIAGSGMDSYQPTEYYFTDKYPELGFNYYRLKSVDNNGLFDYSDIILVNFESGIQLQVSPNPSNGLLFIKTNLLSSNNSEFVVANQLGTIVYRGKLSAFNNTVDLTNLVKGIYIVKLSEFPNVKPQRIIIR